jgi:hypothetical protein
MLLIMAVRMVPMGPPGWRRRRKSVKTRNTRGEEVRIANNIGHTTHPDHRHGNGGPFPRAGWPFHTWAYVQYQWDITTGSSDVTSQQGTLVTLNADPATNDGPLHSTPTHRTEIKERYCWLFPAV